MDDVFCLLASNDPAVPGKEEGALHGTASTGERPRTRTLIEATGTAGLRGPPGSSSSGRQVKRGGISTFCTSRMGSGRPKPVLSHVVF